MPEPSGPHQAYIDERICPVIGEMLDSFVLVGMHRTEDGQVIRVNIARIKPQDVKSLMNVAIVGRHWTDGNIT